MKDGGLTLPGRGTTCTRSEYSVRDATLFRPPLQGHAPKPDSVPAELQPFATSCSRKSTSRCRFTTQSAVSSTGPPERVGEDPGQLSLSRSCECLPTPRLPSRACPPVHKNPLSRKSSLSFRRTCRSHLRADQTARCQAQGEHPSHSRPSPLSRTVHRWTLQFLSKCMSTQQYRAQTVHDRAMSSGTNSAACAQYCLRRRLGYRVHGETAVPPTIAEFAGRQVEHYRGSKPATGERIADETCPTTKRCPAPPCQFNAGWAECRAVSIGTREL